MATTSIWRVKGWLGKLQRTAAVKADPKKAAEIKDGRKHRRNLNTVVVGGSGAGKTRFYAKPNLCQANTSFVVLDPKGELLRDTGYLLKEKGYEVRVLDLLNMEKSHCYNPFVYLRDDNDVQRLVTKQLYTVMCKKLANLCEKEMKSENHEINEHIFGRILPTISMYLTLIENNFTQEEALMIAHKEIQHQAGNIAEENAILTKMPFTYSLFKLFAKSHMKKKYPIEGFTVEWKRHDCKEIHFDIVRCIYKEMCEKYHCPELCTIFCQSDITAFAGYEPKIKFERLGTIGEGANCCDFHFIRGN